MSKISAKCITYGRVETLEESLHCFLNQEYDGEREMVIVNDYPLQKLVFEHPNVRIFNLDKTFDTIGEKENFAVEQCTGNVIAVWDDDDIALPNHLSNIHKYFKDNDLLHWQRGVYFNVDDVTAITAVGNSGIVYSKSIWEKIGGHPLENAGYDVTLVVKINAHSNKIVLASPPDDEVSWFYFWGNRSYHMSGLGTDDDTRPNVIQRHSEHIESERVKGNIPTGEILLNPHLKRDYKQLLINFNKRNLAN